MLRRLSFCFCRLHGEAEIVPGIGRGVIDLRLNVGLKVPPAGQARPSWNDYDPRRFSAGLLLLPTRRYTAKNVQKRGFKPM